jgi:hypothetical protein
MIEPESHIKNKTRFIKKTVCLPIELYKSAIGSYFIGSAENLSFGEGSVAWARLYNPPDSGVSLHVNVWTVTALPAARYQPHAAHRRKRPAPSACSSGLTPKCPACRRNRSPSAGEYGHKTAAGTRVSSSKPPAFPENRRAVSWPLPGSAKPAKRSLKSKTAS